MNASRCLAMTLGSFFPIALRSTSAWPIVKPASIAGDPHDLFLIRDDAVGLREDRLQLRQLVLDLGLPCLRAMKSSTTPP